MPLPSCRAAQQHVEEDDGMTSVVAEPAAHLRTGQRGPPSAETTTIHLLNENEEDEEDGGDDAFVGVDSVTENSSVDLVHPPTHTRSLKGKDNNKDTRGGGGGSSSSQARSKPVENHASQGMSISELIQTSFWACHDVGTITAEKEDEKKESEKYDPPPDMVATTRDETTWDKASINAKKDCKQQQDKSDESSYAMPTPSTRTQHFSRLFTRSESLTKSRQEGQDTANKDQQDNLADHPPPPTASVNASPDFMRAVSFLSEATPFAGSSPETLPRTITLAVPEDGPVLMGIQEVPSRKPSEDGSAYKCSSKQSKPQKQLQPQKQEDELFSAVASVISYASGMSMSMSKPDPPSSSVRREQQQHSRDAHSTGSTGGSSKKSTRSSPHQERSKGNRKIRSNSSLEGMIPPADRQQQEQPEEHGNLKSSGQEPPPYTPKRFRSDPPASSPKDTPNTATSSYTAGTTPTIAKVSTPPRIPTQEQIDNSNNGTNKKGVLRALFGRRGGGGKLKDIKETRSSDQTKKKDTAAVLVIDKPGNAQPRPEYTADHIARNPSDPAEAAKKTDQSNQSTMSNAADLATSSTTMTRSRGSSNSTKKTPSLQPISIMSKHSALAISGQDEPKSQVQEKGATTKEKDEGVKTAIPPSLPLPSKLTSVPSLSYTNYEVIAESTEAGVTCYSSETEENTVSSSQGKSVPWLSSFRGSKNINICIVAEEKSTTTMVAKEHESFLSEDVPSSNSDEEILKTFPKQAPKEDVEQEVRGPCFSSDDSSDANGFPVPPDPPAASLPSSREIAKPPSPSVIVESTSENTSLPDGATPPQSTIPTTADRGFKGLLYAMSKSATSSSKPEVEPILSPPSSGSTMIQAPVSSSSLCPATSTAAAAATTIQAVSHSRQSQEKNKQAANGNAKSPALQSPTDHDPGTVEMFMNRAGNEKKRQNASASVKDDNKQQEQQQQLNKGRGFFRGRGRSVSKIASRRPLRSHSRSSSPRRPASRSADLHEIKTQQNNFGNRSEVELVYESSPQRHVRQSPGPLQKFYAKRGKFWEKEAPPPKVNGPKLESQSRFKRSQHSTAKKKSEDDHHDLSDTINHIRERRRQKNPNDSLTTTTSRSAITTLQKTRGGSQKSLDGKISGDINTTDADAESCSSFSTTKQKSVASFSFSHISSQMTTRSGDSLSTAFQEQDEEDPHKIYYSDSFGVLPRQKRERMEVRRYKNYGGGKSRTSRQPSPPPSSPRRRIGREDPPPTMDVASLVDETLETFVGGASVLLSTMGDDDDDSSDDGDIQDDDDDDGDDVDDVDNDDDTNNDDEDDDMSAPMDPTRAFMNTFGCDFDSGYRDDDDD